MYWILTANVLEMLIFVCLGNVAGHDPAISPQTSQKCPGNAAHICRKLPGNLPECRDILEMSGTFPGHAHVKACFETLLFDSYEPCFDYNQATLSSYCRNQIRL